MVEWDERYCRDRYEALKKARPDLFDEAAEGAYRLLTDDADIRAAQEEAGAYRRRAGLADDDLRVGVLADDPYVLVMREAVAFPDGPLGLYNRLVVPPSMVVMPMIDDGIVLMYRFRHGTRAWHCEFPRGLVEPGAGLEETVKRELAEEIGGETRELVALGSLHASSGITSEYAEMFLARLSRFGAPDAHEAVARIEVMSQPDFKARVADGTITDGPTLAIYARAVARGLVA